MEGNRGMTYKKLRAKPTLRFCLEKNNIMQKTLAEDLGLNVMTINKILCNKAGSPYTAKLIANYLGLDVDDLFEVTS